MCRVEALQFQHVAPCVGCSSNVLKHVRLCMALHIGAFTAWMRTHQLIAHSAFNMKRSPVVNWSCLEHCSSMNAVVPI